MTNMLKNTNNMVVLLMQLLQYYENTVLDCYVTESKELYDKLKTDPSLLSSNKEILS